MISWITVIWSMIAASCFTMASIHTGVWLLNRSSRHNLIFSILAASLGAFSLIELFLMQAETIESYLTLHRVGHVVMFSIVVSIVLFVDVYFRTGRKWLLWTIIALRVLILALAFVLQPTFNFQEIRSLDPLTFLGEEIMMVNGVPRNAARIGEISALLALVFVIDSAVTLWKRGNEVERTRALVVGGAVALCIVLTVTFSILFHTGAIVAPYRVSILFMLIIGAMGFQLSRDIFRVVRLSEDLKESRETVNLAVEAADLAIWRWDIESDLIWVNPLGRSLYGVSENDEIDLGRFLETVHSDDRDSVEEAVQAALEAKGTFRQDYRVVRKNGSLRWIEAIGRVECLDGRPNCIRGVSIDATNRWSAEMEANDLRRDLAHVGRVSLLGQLSSSLVHELSQPLGAAIRNAESAEILLENPTPDLGEVGEILHEIHSNSQRANGVIDRLRSLFRRQSLSFDSVALDDLIGETLALLSADAKKRGVELTTSVPEGLAKITGDRVHLIQVFLNLILNAFDAMEGGGARNPKVEISIKQISKNEMEILIADNGPGIDRVNAEKIFEPFFTTKADGMGMGLAVSRAIVTSHKGSLEVVKFEDAGNTFRMMLPMGDCEHT